MLSDRRQKIISPTPRITIDELHVRSYIPVFNTDEQTGTHAMTETTNELLTALKLALPYVRKVAATAPTEMNRQQRQVEAVKAVRAIEAAIAKAAA
jgi:hypothetical protein